MAAYANYTYYTTVFGGAAIPETDFDQYALRASREVDKITLYRIQSESNPDGYPVDNKVRNATCAVADVLYAQGVANTKTGGGLVESETVDSHTVRLKTMDADKWAKYWAGLIWEAARGYLATTGLLYRGVGRTCGL